MRRLLLLYYSRLFLPVLTACLLLAPLAEAKGPPPGKGGGGGDAVTTTYSGEATAVDITLKTFLLGETRVVLNNTGMLDASGGMREKGISAVAETGLVNVGADILSASVVGSGDMTHAQSTVVGLDVSVLGLLTVSAAVLEAQAQTHCTDEGVATSGSSRLVGLRINGYDIQVSGHPNQTVDIPGLARVVINEQIIDQNTVVTNALHISLLDNHLLYGAISADVVISHARAGITCGDTFVCPVKDFVTGGGQLDVAGGRLSFGMVGGLKANGLSGHFNGVDHRSGGPHIRAHELSDYVLVDALTRRLDYVCDGTGNSLCRVTVTDAGEPGRADHFAIMSGGYAESGLLSRGNLQLHKPGQCAAQDDGGGKGGGNGGGKGKKK